MREFEVVRLKTAGVIHTLFIYNRINMFNNKFLVLMKKKIVNALLMVALVAPSVGSLVSCKDYNEDLGTELRGDLAKEASLRQTLQNQVDALEALVKTIKSCECDLSLYLTKVEAEATYATLEDIAALKLADQNLKNLIDEINKTLGDVKGIDDSGRDVAQWISYLNQQIISVKSVAEEALELAKAGKCDCDFTEINQKLGELETKVAGWEEQLTQVNVTATNALTKAEANYELIVANYNMIVANKKTLDSLITVWNEAGLVNKVSNLENRVKAIEDNYMKKADIEALVQEAKDAAAEAKNLANDAMSKAVEAYNLADNAKNKADQNEIKIGELEEKFKEYVTKTEFDEKMKEVKASIKTVSDKVDALEKELNFLKKDLSNMITGIITQAASNPVLGYLKTPFGLDQYLLAAYYGAADNGIEFPARDGKYYLDASDVETWTPRNLEVMGISNLKNVEGYFTKQDERFVADVDGDYTGNAGTIYVTVNPANVNFEGKTLGLETSAQNASPFALTPLEPSNQELVFGWYRNETTRGVENGFYEAKATLQPEDIDKAKLVIDFQTIGSAIKSVIKDGPQDSRTRISMAEASAKIMQSLESDIPAYGLKASWTDEANSQTHNLFSQYNIGVVAIKPLSFAFLKDKTWSHVDGFDRMRSVVSRVIKEVVVYRPDFANYEFKFKSIELGKDISVDENGQILAQVYYLKNDGSESTPVLIPIEDVFGDLTPTITELVDAIKQNCADDSEVNQKLAEFFNEVKETNNFQTYIDETKESVYEAIDKYLTRIEEHILRVMNNAHRMLYITMFGKQQDGKMALMSNSLDQPSKSNSTTLTLIPTTYTMQFFAPIYKKFVAVTNVYDAATGEELDLAEAKALAADANAGTNMFKVVDGLQNCTINGEKGKIYELTYTAVDYLGVVMIKKFYVEF